MVHIQLSRGEFFLPCGMGPTVCRSSQVISLSSCFFFFSFEFGVIDCYTTSELLHTNDDEDLSLDPQQPHRDAGVAVCTCDPSSVGTRVSARRLAVLHLSSGSVGCPTSRADSRKQGTNVFPRPLTQGVFCPLESF